MPIDGYESADRPKYSGSADESWESDLGDLTDFTLTEESNINNETELASPVPAAEPEPEISEVSSSTEQAVPESNLLILLLLGVLVLALGAAGVYFWFRRQQSSDGISDDFPNIMPSALNSVVEGLLVLDGDLNIVLANPAFTAVAKRSRGELTGNHVSTIPFAGRDNTLLTENDYPWSSVLMDGVPQMNLGVRLTTADDENLSLVTNSSPVMGENKTVAGVLVSFTDVTELEKKEQQLQILRAEVQAENLAKRGLVDGAGGNFEKPISALLNIADLMVKGADQGSVLDQELLQTISFINADTLNIVDDIVELSRLESGLLDVRNSQFDPGSVVNEVVDGFFETANDKDVTVSWDPENNVPNLIESDSVKLRRILLSMVGRAIDATDSGAIRVSGRFEDPFLTITVADAGEGKSAQELVSQFSQPDPESVAEAKAASENTIVKLRLAIGQRLAEALGGSLDVQTELDRSEFTLIIRTRAVELPLLLPDGSTVSELIESRDESSKRTEKMSSQLEAASSQLKKAKAVLASRKAALQQAEALSQSQRVALAAAETKIESEVSARQTAESESAERETELTASLSEAKQKACKEAAERRQYVEEAQTRIEELSAELTELQSVAQNETQSREDTESRTEHLSAELGVALARVQAEVDARAAIEDESQGKADKITAELRRTQDLVLEETSAREQAERSANERVQVLSDQLDIVEERYQQESQQKQRAGIQKSEKIVELKDELDLATQKLRSQENARVEQVNAANQKIRELAGELERVNGLVDQENLIRQRAEKASGDQFRTQCVELESVREKLEAEVTARSRVEEDGQSRRNLLAKEPTRVKEEVETVARAKGEVELESNARLEVLREELGVLRQKTAQAAAEGLRKEQQASEKIALLTTQLSQAATDQSSKSEQRKQRKQRDTQREVAIPTVLATSKDPESVRSVDAEAGEIRLEEVKPVKAAPIKAEPTAAAPEKAIAAAAADLNQARSEKVEPVKDLALSSETPIQTKLESASSSPVMRSMLDRFVVSMSQQLIRMQAACEDHNYPEVASASSWLKGEADALGFNEFVKGPVAELEGLLHERQYTQVSEKIDHLKQFALRIIMDNQSDTSAQRKGMKTGPSKEAVGKAILYKIPPDNLRRLELSEKFLSRLGAVVLVMESASKIRDLKELKLFVRFR